MTSTPTKIFKDGKLRPGIYKIQNLYTKGFLDAYEHSKEMCCRPVKDPGEGLVRRYIPYLWFVSDDYKWEIEPFRTGYTMQRVEPGKPEQFCAPIVGLENGSLLSVAAFPVAWRVEVVNDDIHRGFEYVRIYWGPTRKIMEVPCGKGTRVQFWTAATVAEHYTWWIWKLIPVKVEDDVPTPPQPPSDGPLPSYDEGTTGQSSTRAQHAESERDDFGTIVTEVTTTSTVVTTRKRYRVEDA